MPEASPLTAPKTVVVLGTGYVGLPAALMLAEAGHRVVGVDIDKNVVDAINGRLIPIDEAQLQGLMDSAEVQANLIAKSEPIEADVFLIAVPTPLDRTSKTADLRHVLDAVESLVDLLRPGNLVILESTVPPLTCREVITPLLEQSGLRVGEDIHLAHCPERILPGDIFREIVENERIIGSVSREGHRMAGEIYSSFVKGNLHFTDDVTAEFVKLVENAHRDINIAFANQVGAVAETLSIDARTAIELANHHPRVNVLSPGIGVGGHCIPIDPWFIHQVDPDNSTLISAARHVNDAIPDKIAGKIRRAVAGVKEPRILTLGVAYKANTYDVRESPALEVISILQADGYEVIVHDPYVEAYRMPGELADIAKDTDCLALLVEHTVLVEEMTREHDGITKAMRTPRVLRF